MLLIGRTMGAVSLDLSTFSSTAVQLTTVEHSSRVFDWKVVYPQMLEVTKAMVVDLLSRDEKSD